MKRLSAILSTALGAALVCSSCVGLKNIQKQEYPPIDITLADRMQPANGKLPVDLLIALPDEYEKLNTGIEVHPVMLGNDTVNQRVDLPPFVIEGRFHDRFNDRMDHYQPFRSDSIDMRSRYIKRSDDKYEYNETIPYEGWMKDGRLYAYLYADAYTKTVPLGRVLVGFGSFDLTEFMVKEPREKYYNLSPRKDLAVRGGKDNGSGSTVTFPLASANMDNNTGNNALVEYVNALRDNSEVKDLAVSILISNSPEGSLKYNQELGQERKAAVDAFLKGADIPESIRSYNMIDEDWSGLVAQLDKLELKDRDAIMELINNEQDVDVREHAIRDRHYSDWQLIRKEIYPSLRRAEITVTASYKGADGRIRKHTADGFYFKEQDDAEMYRLHEQMLDAVKDNDYEKAVELADRIENAGLPAVARCNKGTLYMLAGRYDDARVMLQRVEGIPEAQYNLGLAYLLTGDYENADRCLDEFADQNAAIAKLYVKDYDGAMDILRFLPASEARDQLMEIAEEKQFQNK